MTHKELLDILSAYTPYELSRRNEYYHSNNGKLVSPPLPDNIHYCPEAYFPQSTYRNCNIVPYRHERYASNMYHNHNFVELMYQISGCTSNTIEGTATLLKQGDICILPPGVYHLPEVNDDESIMINLLIQTDTFLHIFEQFILDYDHLLSRFACSFHYDKSYPKYYYYRNCSEKTRYLICELIIEYYENKIHSELIIENLLLQIFCELLRSPPEQAELSPQLTSPTQPMLNILQYIYSNFKTVTLVELSEKFGYTPQYLCRMFKTHTENNFGQYLSEIRITRAKQLLTNTNISIIDVAKLSGFECNSYFHRKFKKEVGYTPSEYRMLNDRKKANE